MIQPTSVQPCFKHERELLIPYGISSLFYTVSTDGFYLPGTLEWNEEVHDSDPADCVLGDAVFLTLVVED